MISLKNKIAKLQTFQDRTNEAFHKFCDFCGEKEAYCPQCQVVMFDAFCRAVITEGKEPSRAFEKIQHDAVKEVEKLLKE